jgi:hypothetical protein
MAGATMNFGGTERLRIWYGSKPAVDPELPLSVAESRHKFHGESGHRCDRQIATQCETARSTKAAVAFGLKADISQIGRSRPLAAVTVS